MWNFRTLKIKRMFHNCLKFQSFKSHLPHINEYNVYDVFKKLK
jgi:hypothetical protein